jgi:pimeloyl-ACP methyl ester carboxylesterase
MPKVKANNITMNYDQQGSGEPLILIPFTSADHACYAFQVAEYAKHFTCISLDLRGTGETDTTDTAYTTETLADDVAAFMQAMTIPRAHISGLSLGGAVGLWLAAKHPEKIISLSIHGAWPKTDAFIRSIGEGWQVMARGFDNMPEMVIHGIFPWCLTPELYAAKPEYVEALENFVRSRPKQSVASFLQQSNAVMSHDVDAQLAKITAPTQITFGRHDVLTSRFADRLKQGIANSELVMFEGCSHAPIYENVQEFNSKTLDFLQRHAIRRAGASPAA